MDVFQENRLLCERLKMGNVLEKPHPRSRLVVTVSLLVLLGCHAICCIAAPQNERTEQEQREPSPTIEVQNRLNEQEKQALAQRLAGGKKKIAEVAELKSYKKLSQSEQQALDKLVSDSQKAITPLMQQEVKSLLNSKRYQENLTSGKPLALQALGYDKEAADPAKKELYPEGQIVVFISASMPLPTLRNYVKALEKINGVMVLRGAIQGLKKIGPTIDFSQQLLKKDPHCTRNCSLRNVPLLIDPLLFRRHHITAVPAIAFQPEGIVSGCDASPNLYAGDVIYGDVSLSGALEKLQQISPNHILKTLSQKLWDRNG